MSWTTWTWRGMARSRSSNRRCMRSLMRRLLKATGSMYLHCDPTAGHHYLKLLMDSVFGRGRFMNETVWKR